MTKIYDDRERRRERERDRERERERNGDKILIEKV